jgi:hypothetical protein
MQSFKTFLNENYKNFIGPDSTDRRRVWADQVWDILQKSYAPIDGIKGSGFNTKEDMIQNIPFWKLYTKNDKVVAAAFYKDKNGRKSVAIATDGSDLGRKIVGDIFKASLGVSYGEKSGRALATMVNSIPWETLSNFLLKPDVVSKLMKKNLTPVDEYGKNNLDSEDQFTYDKFPQLRPYMYVRKLDGKPKLKVAIGTPNLPIR